jgi:hypothetical protein
MIQCTDFLYVLSGREEVQRYQLVVSSRLKRLTDKLTAIIYLAALGYQV